MNRKFSGPAALILGAPLAVSAAAPHLDDYVQGIRVDAYTGLPVAEVLLPDEVYQRVTREDLGDIRVFNADGMPVPHAFCAAPIRVEPTVERDSLPVFELQGPTKETAGSTHVEVDTADGTQVRV